MAEASWPSPTHNSRAVTDAEYEQLAAAFSGDGVYGDPTDTPVVSAGIGLKVTIPAGVEASVRGHFWESGTTDLSLDVSPNTSGSRRYDWIVLRLDRSTWDVTAALHEGTPGAGKPSVTRQTGTTGVFEVALGYVQIEDSATSVTVVPYTQYVGASVRPTTSTTHTAIGLGGIEFESDTNRWTGWNGSERVSLYEDSGTLSLSGGFDTWDQHIVNVGRRIGPMVWLRIGVKRKGSTLHKDDPDGSKIAVLPSALRFSYCNNFFGGRVSNGSSGRVEVRTDGTVWITSLSGDVPIGETVVATVCYMIF